MSDALDMVLCQHNSDRSYRGIHADVNVYIFAYLHTDLLTEINMLDTN